MIERERSTEKSLFKGHLTLEEKLAKNFELLDDRLSSIVQHEADIDVLKKRFAKGKGSAEGIADKERRLEGEKYTILGSSQFEELRLSFVAQFAIRLDSPNFNQKFSEYCVAEAFHHGSPSTRKSDSIKLFKASPEFTRRVEVFKECAYRHIAKMVKEMNDQYAVSLVPKKNEIRRQDFPISFPPSEASGMRCERGVESNDPILSQSKEELFRFLMTYASERPIVHAKVIGVQDVWYEDEGYIEQTTINFKINVTEMLTSDWIFCDAVPHTGLFKSARSDYGEWDRVLDDFINSERKHKIIILHKRFRDTECCVEAAIEDFIKRECFYPGKISVRNFTYYNADVTARTPETTGLKSLLAKFFGDLRVEYGLNVNATQKFLKSRRNEIARLIRHSDGTQYIS